MVAAAVLVTGIWVVAVVVATVGVGSVDKVGLVGIGYTITLTLNLLFTGALAFLFFLPSWIPESFLVRSFCQLKICWYVVDYQVCLLVINMFSSFLSGMESCVPGVAGYDLGGPVSPECVDASHHLDFDFNIHSFYW